MANNDITKPPEKGPGDTALDVTKTILSAIPGLGGPAVQFLATIVIPPLERRRVEWIESIVKKLIELENKIDGFVIEDLKDNETFVTTVMQASSIAVRNHQKEKLKALQNIILNTALSGFTDADFRDIFFNIVDISTVYHIGILKALDKAPDTWPDGVLGETYPAKEVDFKKLEEERRKDEERILKKIATGHNIPKSIIEKALPELVGQYEIIEYIVNDLYRHKLITFKPEEVHERIEPKINPEDTGERVRPRVAVKAKEKISYTTILGKAFIRFISEPQTA